MNTLWTKDRVIALLTVNDLAVERALVALHDKQTASEKDAQVTTVRNGVGFSAFDAEIFSSLAEWVRRGRNLTTKQLALCRKTNKAGKMRIAKYAEQLLGIANNRLAPTPAPVPAPAQREMIFTA